MPVPFRLRSLHLVLQLRLIVSFFEIMQVRISQKAAVLGMQLNHLIF